MPMRNIKLILQYDGRAYHGWQSQKNAVAVQDVLQRAVEKITKNSVQIIGCGRTDAGVHAAAYVCNFFSDTTIPAENLVYALNANLPDDIVCQQAYEVSLQFHSKYSAVKKRYTYRILNRKINDVFWAPYTWQVKVPLEIEAMKKAAEAFVGTHDFAGFASSGLSVKTTVRTIYALEVEKDGDFFTMDVTGNGFLYNMVRIIAGTLAFSGMGKLDADKMPEIIASCDRTRAGITAPAKGLCLSEVIYEEGGK